MTTSCITLFPLCVWFRLIFLHLSEAIRGQWSRWLTSPISGVRRLGGEHTDCTKFSMVRIDCVISVCGKRVSVTLPESQTLHILMNMNKAKRHWSVDCQKAAEGPCALPVLSGSCCWWSTVSCRLDRLHKTCLNPSYCSSAGLPFLSWPQCSTRFAVAFHKTHSLSDLWPQSCFPCFGSSSSCTTLLKVQHLLLLCVALSLFSTSVLLSVCVLSERRTTKPPNLFRSQTHNRRLDALL